MSAPDVFAPAQLGPITLRNRTVKAATFEGRTPQGQVTDELVDFHAELGRGGVGMTTVAYLAVAPEGRTHREGIVVGSDTRAGLERLAAAVHETGAKLAGQMGHAGPVANGRSNGVHAVAASRMPNPMSMQMIRSATEADLTRITKQYVAAARLLVDAGFDALELHMAHSYLISSFLAPALNRRHDSWGGSLENRTRLGRQIARAVRDEVGNEVALYAKVSLSDGFKGGVDAETGLAFAGMLQDDGNLDALQMSGGSSLMNPMYLFRGDVPAKEFIAQMPQPLKTLLKAPGGAKFLKHYEFDEAYFLEKARVWRSELSMPLMLLGGVNELDTMKQAMTEGFDFVVLGRALLRDPDLINRLNAGTLTAGRCTHCNQCVPTIYAPGGIYCHERTNSQESA